MGITDPGGRAWVRGAVGGGLVVGAILFAVYAFRSSPQMGADDEVFAAVDALFTAVTGRSESRLADCEQRLHAHRAAGKLPTDAADHLDRVIARARGGDWETAAERLYTFMLAQRREGAHEPKAKPQKTTATRPTRR